MNVRGGRSPRSRGGAYNAVLRPCATCSHCIKTMAGTIQTRWMVPRFPLSLHEGRSQVDKSFEDLHQQWLLSTGTQPMSHFVQTTTSSLRSSFLPQLTMSLEKWWP